MITRAVAFSLLGGLVWLGACSRPTFAVGEGCEINSDCASPLVCVIGHCRRQCVDSRDCGAGLRCLVAPDSALGGGCQLERERDCALTSECTPGLVCQNGTCTTRCVTDRDCAAGAWCDDMTGVLACVEPPPELCVYASDCPVPLVCGRDQLCHEECHGDRDCPFPRHCVASLCELVDGGP
jgi:hypothetical protein